LKDESNIHDGIEQQLPHVQMAEPVTIFSRGYGDTDGYHRRSAASTTDDGEFARPRRIGRVSARRRGQNFGG
jgi:hypothetical protein